MSVQYEVSAKVGQDRNDKPIYRKIGVILKTSQGAYMLKLETIPVIGWDGWAYLNPPKAAEGGSGGGKQKQAPAKEKEPPKGGGTFDDLDDDIPF